MFTDQDNPQMTELRQFLTQHAKLSGAQILAYLIRFRGHKFHCSKLSHLVFPPDYDRMELLAQQADLQDTLDMYRNCEEQSGTISVRDPANPQLITSKSLDAFDLADLITCRCYDNPLTDSQTLGQISHRIKYLREIISTSGQDCSAHRELSSEQAKAELLALYKYRSECLQPGNKIKNFNPETSKTYQALYQAVSRLLAKLSETQKPLYDFVKTHLKTGAEFIWR